MRRNRHIGVHLPESVPGRKDALGTLLELCRTRASAEPDRKGFGFLGDGYEESDALTLGELDRIARAIAVTLRRQAHTARARALLSYPPGLDFHVAFWGCLYAGLIPVPVAPLDGTRGNVKWTRVESIAGSSDARLFLSTRSALDAAEPVLAAADGLARLTRVATDEVCLDLAEQWTPPVANGEMVAYLQYSSGSTGLPKGVAVTHANVLHNLSLIHDSTSRPADEAGLPRPPSVSWLPLHHNMGLISSVLDPLFSGRDVTLLPTMTFVQRPLTWLRAISALGRADSCAPNFAFDLCVRRITDVQRQDLDLSRWEMALVGGEPVRADTLSRFSEVFARTGFRRQALCPGYGLAESTVMVSAGPVGAGPVVLRLDAESLAAGTARIADGRRESRELVGCGRIHRLSTVVAVDPSTGKPRGEDEVGEILVSGPSVATGYWDAPGETAETFSASLPDLPGERFLRTGDLGFLHDGQLFVTGRAKDVIIIAGANHYPQDIEATVEACHPAVREMGACAVAVDDGVRERLVVLVETTDPPTEEVKREIRRAVHAKHRIQVHEVVLLEPGTLPLTTTGKLQRRNSRDRYLGGSFETARLE
ncbi:fatty acyl-AMP ligase [Wenjunlia tyrosinilytica]|uniref:Acyl-CoA synthetase n=1 Tax=Wenjunlia tyrosinilytica TaxID=1544741 RepID=A0A917ZSC2_9ACTN|nr:fatty acyl-AMP ligase [Wenjunlia tyrosinilytica]GGO90207.1 acyl-CoA synthetase [Wenjunlia tyrosinilytica]